MRCLWSVEARGEEGCSGVEVVACGADAEVEVE